MSTTKTLPPGIPIADATGKVTSLAVKDIARQIGDLIGVRSASYTVTGPGWIRIASIGANGGILMISNIYNLTAPVGTVISFSGAHFREDLSARIISGSPKSFSKFRFVSNGSGEVFIEVNSCVGEGRSDAWTFRIISTDIKSYNGNSTVKVYDTCTPGSVPEGFTATEYTIAQLKSGGV